MKKMQILAKADAHVGTRVDLVARFGLLVSTLNTIANKRPAIEKSYSRCAPSFSKEPKALKTLPLEEFETILSECSSKTVLPMYPLMDPI